MRIERFRLRALTWPGVICLLLVSFLSGCTRAPANRLQAYIEGEFVYVAAPLSGALEKLSVQRGDQAKTNDLLFVLESASEQAAHDEAKLRLVQARATLEDVRKGKRLPEIQALEAQVKQAQAALEFSSTEVVRQEKLGLTNGATTQQEIDRARAGRDQDRERLRQSEAELETARLGARPDQIAAAEANVHALEAALVQTEWALTQKRQVAPQSGVVFDTFYREGEWVAAGRPIVALLPPAQVKLRVFVPQPWLGGIHLGDSVQVLVDGADGPVTAKVSFISPRAEFTPPVIYSRENRAKFVFLIEAIFDPAVAARLHPGQPVDVEFKSVPAP